MLLIHRHLDEMRRRNRRPGTIAARRAALMRLQKFLRPTPLIEASYDELVAWIFDVRHLTPESQATEISHTRQFFRWAIDTELLDVDPTARLRRPTVPRRLPRPMDSTELEVAIGSAPIQVKPWLLLAAYAGLRCAEIARLRAEDLWWSHEPPLVFIGESKGGGMSSVPLSPWLVGELRRCDLPTRGWLFRRHDGRPGPIPAHRVSQIGNAYLHSLGYAATMHRARHWFAGEVLRASGGNLRVTQEALRHASITSTQLYTFVQPTEVYAAVAELPHPDAA